MWACVCGLPLPSKQAKHGHVRVACLHNTRSIIGGAQQAGCALLLFCCHLNESWCPVDMSVLLPPVEWRRQAWTPTKAPKPLHSLRCVFLVMGSSAATTAAAAAAAAAAAQPWALSLSTSPCDAAHLSVHLSDLSFSICTSFLYSSVYSSTWPHSGNSTWCTTCCAPADADGA